jgi:hypothetical protein
MTNSECVDYEFGWFEKNRANIIAGHRGEWVAVRGHTVRGYFPSPAAAADSMRSTGVKMGDFIVQRCLPREEDVIHCFTPGITLV